jgi:hypothetical protein
VLPALTVLASLAALAGWGLLLRHAWGRSVGTATLVLLVPGYAPWYAFSQFEHPRKGPVLGAWLGGHGVAAMAMAWLLVSRTG